MQEVAPLHCDLITGEELSTTHYNTIQYNTPYTRRGCVCIGFEKARGEFYYVPGAPIMTYIQRSSMIMMMMTLTSFFSPEEGGWSKKKKKQAFGYTE